MENLEHYHYTSAKKRVKEFKSFYTSLLAYVLVIPFLAYLNHRTTPYPWVIFPIVAWGFGLLMMWLSLKGVNPILGKAWEERKIKEYMNNKEF
jgi:hypothetical protein